MAPKPVDKARVEEKARMAADKTFGLKNKNKSKTVQKYIKSITSNATGRTRPVEEAERKEKLDKAASVQNAALMNSLFNKATDKKGRAYDADAKKKAKQMEEDAIAAGKKLKEEVKKALIEGIANTIRLTDPKKGVRMSEMGGHPIIAALKNKFVDEFKIISLLLFIKANDKIFWVSDEEDSNPSIRCKEDVDLEIAPDDRSIEEILQERLRELPPGGTPVTKESFFAWKKKKEDDRYNKILADAKASGKKTDKGAMLSGKDLFTFDASLFVDDADAVGEEAYDDMKSDAESDEEKEEEKPKPVFSDSDDDDEDEDDDDDFCFDDVEKMNTKILGEKEDSGAQGSADGVAINKDLFLQAGGDLPDDLDDLDDLDDDDE